jgi:hypothetical protein
VLLKEDEMNEPFPEAVEPDTMQHAVELEALLFNASETVKALRRHAMRDVGKINAGVVLKAIGNGECDLCDLIGGLNDRQVDVVCENDAVQDYLAQDEQFISRIREDLREDIREELRKDDDFVSSIVENIVSDRGGAFESLVSEIAGDRRAREKMVITLVEALSAKGLKEMLAKESDEFATECDRDSVKRALIEAKEKLEDAMGALYPED